MISFVPVLSVRIGTCSSYSAALRRQPSLLDGVKDVPTFRGNGLPTVYK